MTFVETHGRRIPALGYGTWPMKGDECVRSVSTALEVGYRHLDTAAAYENEAEVGRAVAASGLERDEIFITTKVWKTNLGARDLTDSAERSREALGRIDLLLIHWPNPDIPLSESMTALENIRARGVAQSIGVSNFDAALIAEATGLAPVVCDQIPLHPYIDQRATIAACRDRDVAVTAYSPLAKGRVHEDPVLVEIGSRHGKRPGQIALRWLLQQDGVIAIPKSANRDRMSANIDVFDFTLTEDEMTRIATLTG